MMMMMMNWQTSKPISVTSWRTAGTNWFSLVLVCCSADCLY